MPPQDNSRELILATQKVSESLIALQKGLAGTNPAAKAQIKALNSNSKGIAPMQKSMEGLSNSFRNGHAAIGKVGSELIGTFKEVANPMHLLSQALTQGIAQADQYQQGALRLGMDVNQIVGKFPGEMSTVTGGFVAAMDATFKQTDMGMTKLGKHTSMAAVRTAALDGNINGLIKMQRRMETSLGMDQEAVDRSSKRMIQLSQQYGISSDRLVTAMENLAKSESTMAALGIGEQTNQSVMELTAKWGAGNEKLISEFTNSILATGSKAVQFSVLGGIQDLQSSMMMGNATTEQLETGILDQGRRYLNIVRGMQADGVQMNVALGQLESLYGPGAQASMKLAQAYEKFTPEQIKKQAKSAQIQENWGNTLNNMKEEILTPIKVAITNKLPEIIKTFKTFMPVFRGILKGVLIVASSIMIKRGLGAMMGGVAGGNPMRAMMGAGVMGAGAMGLSTGLGVEAGGSTQAAIGIAAGMIPLIATMFSKKKGLLGAAQYGFGKRGGETGILAEKLGSVNNPMHVFVINSRMMGGDAGGGRGGGRMMSKALNKFSNTKFGRKIPGLRKLTKVLGRNTSMLSKGSQVTSRRIPGLNKLSRGLGRNTSMLSRSSQAAGRSSGMLSRALGRSTTSIARSGSLMSRGMSVMGRSGQMMGKGAASVFGKTGIINRGMATASRGLAGQTQIAAKGIGGVMKRLGGKAVAGTFAKMLGKKLAVAAAVQVVPVVGQIIGVGMAIWTVAEIGMFAWRKRKEKRESEMAQAISEDLHERQKDRIRSELEAFNKGLQKHDSYMRITNEELRKSMRQAISGSSQKEVLERLVATTVESLRVAQDNRDANTDTAVQTAPKLTGPED